MRLTAAERVLLHLLPLWNAKDAVRGATQEGIAEGAGLRRSHVPRAVRRLVEEGAAEVREGRLRGRGRKVRVYALTEPGIRRAKALVDGLMPEPVSFGDRQLTLGELATELRLSASEVVAGLDDDGRWRPTAVALALPETELIEREAEMRGLVEWLRGAAPAAAVYGSRGMGKTALGRAFARAARRPTAWVDIRPDDPEALRRDLTASLARLGAKGTAEALRGDLAALRPLVILDGWGEVAEGVVDAAAEILSDLSASPGAKMLVLAQEATPSYCRFYGTADVRTGRVAELRIRGLSPEGTRRLLGNPAIREEALRQVYLLTKGCPLYLVLIRDGDAAGLRQVSRFTPAEIRLLMFSRAAAG